MKTRLNRLEEMTASYKRYKGFVESIEKALGEKAGLRQETISLIENGNPAAKLETILAVLSALNLEFQVAPHSGLAGALLRGIEQHEQSYEKNQPHAH